MTGAQETARDVMARRRQPPGRRQRVPTARLRKVEPLAGYTLPAPPPPRVASIVPDAWYALHPDNALTDAWQNGDVPQVTFGADDRQPVSDTTVAPYRWVALLEIEAQDGSRVAGDRLAGWSSPGRDRRTLRLHAGSAGLGAVGQRLTRG